MQISRRGLFGTFVGAVGVGFVDQRAVGAPMVQLPEAAAVSVAAVQECTALHAKLQQLLGEEIVKSWFGRMKVEENDGTTLTVSLPVKFIRNWVRDHYSDELLEAAQAVYGTHIDYVHIVWRKPGEDFLEA